MEDMTAFSQELLARWQSSGKHTMFKLGQQTHVQMVCADATSPNLHILFPSTNDDDSSIRKEEQDWLSEVGVVFLNSLVFERALMEAVSARLAKGLPAGSVVLTTQLLPQTSAAADWCLVGDSDECFDTFDSAALTEPTVYVQRKLPSI